MTLSMMMSAMGWHRRHQHFLLLCALAPLVSACVQSTVVPFQPTTPHPAVSLENVEIYRGRGPFQSFQELGAITVRSSRFDIPWIYRQLRRDAGAFGAEAVIDLKIHSEKHTEWRTDQHCTVVHECGANNQCTAREYCTPTSHPVLVTYFVAVGTMIRSQK